MSLQSKLRRVIARLRFGTELAVCPRYASLLREIERRRARQEATRALQDEKAAIVHAALRGRT